MTDKELGKLSRRQLLNIMLQQSMKIDELENELECMKKELEAFKGDVRITAESRCLVDGAINAAKQAIDEYLNTKSLEQAQED